jgi:hypothetical protein
MKEFFLNFQTSRKIESDRRSVSSSKDRRYPDKDLDKDPDPDPDPGSSNPDLRWIPCPGKTGIPSKFRTYLTYLHT